MLIPRITENLAVLSDTSSSNEIIVDAVISSVAMCYVFARYDVKLSGELRENMLKCLKLPPNRMICEKVMGTINQLEGEELGYITFFEFPYLKVPMKRTFIGKIF